MSLDALKKDIETKSFRRLYYICGKEAYLKHRWLMRIKEAMFDENSITSDCYSTDGDTADLSEFCMQLDMFPVLAEKRLIILRDVAFDGEIGKYILKNPECLNDETVVIFFEQTEKKGKQNETERSFLKLVDKVGLKVEMKPLDKPSLCKWVKIICKSRGRIVSDSAAAYFIDTVGTDMFTVESELNKLISFCQGEVTRDAVDTVCAKTDDTVAFDLAKAITAKNLGEAFGVMKRLESAQQRDEQTAGTVFGAVTLLYNVKLLSEAYPDYNDIAKILDKNPYRIKLTLDQLRRVGIDKLEKMLDLCAEADIALKNGTTDGGDIIAPLVAKIVTLL